MGGAFQPACKQITVVIGDNEPQAIRDIEASLNNKVPLVVVRGTPLTDQICDLLDNKDGTEAPRHQPEMAEWGASNQQIIKRVVHSGKAVATVNSSEEVASVIHLLLTISV